MTVFIDPVIGAALVAGLLPILPGLPCPTCRGTGWRCRNSNLMCTHRVHQGCEDCTGSGVWTPPDSPVPIGVTSARPEVGRIGDVLICSVVPKGKFDDISNHTPPHDIVLSSMIGEGTLRALKVVDGERLDQDLTPELVCLDRLGLVLPLVERHQPSAGCLVEVVVRFVVGHVHYGPLPSNGRDISSALPFLPGLKPDDTVYLLDGFTESVECPDDTDGDGDCARCVRPGPFAPQRGRHSCPFPVDAPDHPCVQP